MTNFRSSCINPACTTRFIEFLCDGIRIKPDGTTVEILYAWLVIRRLLPLTAFLFVPIGSADMATMKQRWDSNITLMTGIAFPNQIYCLTEKVFSCSFDTENCKDDIRGYRKDFPAQSWYFDFPKMRVTMDKGDGDQESEGDLRYLGGTTYLMALDKYPQLTGWIASFSYQEKQVYLTWYLSSSLGIAIQGHSGRCEVQ